MRRTECSACHAGKLDVILDLGDSPVADAYADTPEQVVERYPLEVVICDMCRLVQLTEVLPQEQLFGTGYSFYSSASAPLSRYHEEYARQVIETSADRYSSRRPAVIEIGCNDGDFLRHLAAAGWPTLGVDPAGGPVKVARERGLEVLNEPFNIDVALRIQADLGVADVVVANHVLAHVESVYETLAGIQLVLADDGVAYVEVQYLPDLLVNNAYDLVYHEHRNFFSLTTLSSAAARCGLGVTGARLTGRQGGSLRVTLRHDEKSVSEPDGIRVIRESERWLDDDATYAGLQGRVERLRERLVDVLVTEQDAGRRLIGYGAPAKATTLLNFCAAGDMLELVVDTTPAKQGRYVPGVGVKIVPPEDVLLGWNTTALVLAWNYASTIIRANGLDCRWIIPVPAPMIL